VTATDAERGGVGKWSGARREQKSSKTKNEGEKKEKKSSNPQRQSVLDGYASENIHPTISRPPSPTTTTTGTFQGGEKKRKKKKFRTPTLPCLIMSLPIKIKSSFVCRSKQYGRH
jgi:hypothetical protein